MPGLGRRRVSAIDRVLIIGTTGSGKSSLARRLAARISLDHIEMDGLFWQPGWTRSEPEAFRERVDVATSIARWVADADYVPEIGDLVWNRADTVVWLDLPDSLIVHRLIRRTVKRAFLRTKLWAGNRQSISTLFDKGSLRRWVRRVNAADKQRYEAMFADDRWSHIDRVRIRSKRELRSWLATR